MKKKNTLPILTNVLLQLKDKKLSIVATDLDIIFYDEIQNVEVIKEGSTTTSAAILYDILRKISSNADLNFEQKQRINYHLKVKTLILVYYVYLQIIFLVLLKNLKLMRSNLIGINF